MNISSEELHADGFWRAGTVYPDAATTLRVQIDRDDHGFVVYIMVVNHEFMTYFPQSWDSISRHRRLRLETEGRDGEPHEAEDLLVQLAELRLEHLKQVSVLA